MSRFNIVKGAYIGTSDDRADRYYIQDEESPVVDRRGRGFASRGEAEKELEYRTARWE